MKKTPPPPTSHAARTRTHTTTHDTRHTIQTTETQQRQDVTSTDEKHNTKQRFKHGVCVGERHPDPLRLVALFSSHYLVFLPFLLSQRVVMKSHFFPNTSLLCSVGLGVFGRCSASVGVDVGVVSRLHLRYCGTPSANRCSSTSLHILWTRRTGT